MNSFRPETLRLKSLTAAIVLSQLLCLVPSACLAGDDSVRLAGQVVFSAKSAANGMSADQRADAIQRNLDNALVAASDKSPSAVNIVYVKGVPVITLGGYQVVTVNSVDAKDAGTTPAILAQQWADSLRNSLKDQGSVNSYVNQLSGGYQSSAPPATASSAPSGGGAPPLNTTQYNPPPQGSPDQGGAPYDQFGRSTAPPQGAYQGGAGQYDGGPPPGAYNGNANAGGYPPQGGYGGPQGGGYGGPPQGGYQRGRVVYAPAGTTMPVSLRTSISTQAASPGDLIEAALTDGVNLGDSSIPPGTVLVGQVVNSKKGGFLGRSGMLEVKFNSMRTPDGQQVPISAHIVGGIGKYTLDNSQTAHGETWKNKVGQVALRGGLGAGLGAGLGTAVGAIAGRSGTATGRGAWSGAAIGGGVGVADSLILRKGKEVTIKSGTQMQVQLDSPATLAGGGPGPGGYGGAPYGGGPGYGAPPYGGGPGGPNYGGPPYGGS